MKILIFFATIEGQTGKIARFMNELLQKAGHEVVMADAMDMAAQADPEAVDKVILAASVHERRHPKLFEMFLAAQRNALDPEKTLLVSVSLMAAFPGGVEAAGEFVTEMEMRTGFKAAHVALVAGAVRPSSYDYFASQVLRHVVLKGSGYRPEDGEKEFTDWDALTKQVTEFVAA